MIVTFDMLRGLKKSGSKPGEYVASECPQCGAQGTFYVNLISKKYICFRSSCNLRGKLEDFGSEESNYHSESLDKLQSQILNLYRCEEGNKELDLDLFSEPVTSETEEKYPFCCSYLRERNFSESDIKRYHIRVGKEYYDKEHEKTEMKWRGRIIFPFFEEGLPIYAIGRSYIGTNPKYLNTDGKKSYIVYNIDNIRDRKCIICEGLISSIFAEKYSDSVSGVCLLGCTMSDYQFYKIRSAADCVWVCMDGDVDSSSICSRFVKSGADTRLISLPVVDGKGLDPAECTKEQFKYYFDNAKRLTLLDLKKENHI